MSQVVLFELPVCFKNGSALLLSVCFFVVSDCPSTLSAVCVVAHGGVHRVGEKPGAGVQRQGGSGRFGEGGLC